MEYTGSLEAVIPFLLYAIPLDTSTTDWSPYIPATIYNHYHPMNLVPVVSTLIFLVHFLYIPLPIQYPYYRDHYYIVGPLGTSSIDRSL
jgi:hypothetical protein